MKRAVIFSLLYDFLQNYRPEMEDQYGSLETEDFLEMAAYPSNWTQVDSESLKSGCEAYGHAEGATCYRMWKLNSHQDIRVHIWHNEDILLQVLVV